MRKLQYGLVFLTLALLVACATPQTFNEGLAAGIGTVTGIRTGAVTLLNANKITADDAENIQKQCDNIREGLVIARELHKTNPTAAQAKLDATTTALRALQAYVAARQGGVK